MGSANSGSGAKTFSGRVSSDSMKTPVSAPEQRRLVAAEKADLWEESRETARTGGSAAQRSSAAAWETKLAAH